MGPAFSPLLRTCRALWSPRDLLLRSVVTGRHGPHISWRGGSGYVRRRGENAGAAAEDEDPEVDMEGDVDVGMKRDRWNSLDRKCYVRMGWMGRWLFGLSIVRDCT